MYELRARVEYNKHFIILKKHPLCIKNWLVYKSLNLFSSATTFISKKHLFQIDFAVESSTFIFQKQSVSIFIYEKSMRLEFVEESVY